MMGQDGIFPQKYCGKLAKNKNSILGKRGVFAKKRMDQDGILFAKAQ